MTTLTWTAFVPSWVYFTFSSSPTHDAILRRVVVPLWLDLRLGTFSTLRDYVLKFVLIGDAAVGKSSLLVRLTDQRFLTNPDATLGVEFGSKLIHIADENKTIKLQCWDTAGTEYFRSITRSYYRGAAGALLVYDVTNRASFEHAEDWLKDVREHADPNLTCILVANKVDLVSDEGDTTAPSSTRASLEVPNGDVTRKSSDGASTIGRKGKKRREVSKEEAQTWAKEHGKYQSPLILSKTYNASEDVLFIEASAKTGVNVEEAFDQAARDILRKIRQG
ncbi:hypothetical protein FRC19_002782, partial [Serendipita sp. 401]